MTYLLALAGGALIGLAATLLLWLNGRIAGISGIVGGMLTGAPDIDWRAAFTIGLLMAGAGAAFLAPQAMVAPDRPLWIVAIAGLAVGLGVRMGSGCTSGHGVCGISRFSKRSMVATGTFMAFGILAAGLAGMALR